MGIGLAVLAGLWSLHPDLGIIGVDWVESFAPAGQAWLQGINPYRAVSGYASPPWGLLVLGPLSFLPLPVALSLPVLALLALAYARRQPILIPLVGLSIPFLGTILYGNIDWLVMVGVAIGGPIGILLDTLKPQAGGVVILAEVARRRSWPGRLLLCGLLITVALITAPLWGDWLHAMTRVGYAQHRSLSAFYPRWMGWLVGGVALGFTVRRQSPIWGCIASLALAPYWQIYSLLPLTFLVAERDWRWALLLDGAGWALVLLALGGH